MSQPSLLDARLAEIDERLRLLQDGLSAGDDAGRDVPPVEMAPPTPLRPGPHGSPAPAHDAESTDRLRELAAAHERLLELHRDLLAQYATLLERRVSEPPPVSVVAGPFADAGALRAFQQGLRALPGVTAVTTRELLDGDRVAVDVRLAGR